MNFDKLKVRLRFFLIFDSPRPTNGVKMAKKDRILALLSEYCTIILELRRIANCPKRGPEHSQVNVTYLVRF
jgi:hypothetical protein